MLIRSNCELRYSPFRAHNLLKYRDDRTLDWSYECWGTWLDYIYESSVKSNRSRDVKPGRLCDVKPSRSCDVKPSKSCDQEYYSTLDLIRSWISISCIIRKFTKHVNHKINENKVTEFLQLVKSDLFDSTQVASHGNALYFITFLDEFTK